MNELTNNQQELLALHFVAFASQYFGIPLTGDILVKMVEKGIDPFPTITRRSTLNKKAGSNRSKFKRLVRFFVK